MSFDKGFNFRDTAAPTSQPAEGPNETYVLHDNYPTTRNAVTFGWDTGIAGFDRTVTNDRRLCGINYNNATSIFQMDLPATGTYIVHLALGDQGGGGNASCTAVVKDNTSTLATVNFAANVANVFTDATGAVLNQTTWPGSEVGVSLTFATTTLKLVMTSAGYWTIAHLRVVQSSGPAPFGPEMLQPLSQPTMAHFPTIVM